MSRSRKHTPVTGFTGSASEKEAKRAYNRALRRGNRVRVESGEEDDFLHVRDVSDPWTMPKDGKTWVNPDLGHWYFKAMLK